MVDDGGEVIEVVAAVVGLAITLVVVMDVPDGAFPLTDNTISVSARTPTTPTPATNRHRLKCVLCGSTKAARARAIDFVEPISDPVHAIVVPNGRFRALTDQANTQVENYRLVSLVVDERPVQFSVGTMSLTTRWLGIPGIGHRVNRWQGEITSATYRDEMDLSTRVHRFVAQTGEGQVIEAYFTITRSDDEGFEIVGSGDFKIS